MGRVLPPRLPAVSSSTRHKEQGETRLGGIGHTQPAVLDTNASIRRLSLLQRYAVRPTLKESPAGVSRQYITVYLPTHLTQRAHHVPQEPKKNKKKIEGSVQVRQPAGGRDHPRVEAQGLAGPLQPRARTPGAAPGTAIWNNLFQPTQEATSATVNRVNNIIVHDSSGQPLHTRPATQLKDGSHFSVTGGVGSPGLGKVPVSLGHSNNHLVPIHHKVTTAEPISGGVEEDLRLHHPLFGGSFNGQSGQQFVSVWNQAPEHRFPDTSQGSPFTSSLAAPPQTALGDDPRLQEYLSHLTTTPRSSGPRDPSALATRPYVSAGVTSFFYPTPSPLQTQTQRNPSQILGEYYANLATSNPADPQDSFQNEPVSLDRLDLQSSPDSIFLPAETPFIPAFSNFHTSQSSDLMADLEEEVVTPEPATLSSSTSQNCFSNTLCILTLAAALALGVTTAFVSPFFSPALLGRRKRSRDYIMFSEDSATAFVNQYVNLKDESSLGVPPSEELLFKALHDPVHNPTRGLFTRLEHFIMKSRDKLPNSIVQQVHSKELIPLPDDVLKKPTRSSQPWPPPGSPATSPGGARNTPINNHEEVYSPKTSEVSTASLRLVEQTNYHQVHH